MYSQQCHHHPHTPRLCTQIGREESGTFVRQQYFRQSPSLCLTVTVLMITCLCHFFVSVTVKM